MSEILITKSTGEVEPFNRSKLERSLSRSSASIFEIEDVVRKVEKSLRKGMTTEQIYKTAYAILNKRSPKSALKYSIKRSLLSLGPTGFPFEKFLAEMMKRKGYRVETGVFAKGNCIEHEIDVVAHNDRELILTEVKFHNDLSTKTDTKVGLYVKARFDDLKDAIFHFPGAPQKMTKGLIITNTKFTYNVIKYANCSGLNMIGWDYPEKGNLYDLIDETRLHPITCLTQISNAQKQAILARGIVSCSELGKNEEMIKALNLSDRKKRSLMEEISSICS